MNSNLFQSFTLPRLMILACGLLTVTLLIAAPLVLPHVSSAEASAVSTSTHIVTPESGIQSPIHRAKPSAAHRATRAIPVVKVTMPQSANNSSEEAIVNSDHHPEPQPAIY